MANLAQRLARGDSDAFAELYDLYAGRLHHYLTVRLGSRTEADDVLQETFLRLVRTRWRRDRVNNLSAYVFAMARNEASRDVTRRGRERTLCAEELFLYTDSDARQRETAEMIAVGLGELNERQREVVELKIYGGLTFSEIAQMTGVPLPTAATRYRAALERLKKWLTRQLS
jgi:RNA polymerase sigma-70 factor (ECF subfamily)